MKNKWYLLSLRAKAFDEDIYHVIACHLAEGGLIQLWPFRYCCNENVKQISLFCASASQTLKCVCFPVKMVLNHLSHLTAQWNHCSVTTEHISAKSVLEFYRVYWRTGKKKSPVTHRKSSYISVTCYHRLTSTMLNMA